MTDATSQAGIESRVLIIPRWSGGPESDWYPWFIGQLQHAGLENVTVANLPSPHEPVVGSWVDGLLLLLDDQPEQTVLVGHSVGCQAIVRALARLPNSQSVAGTLLVAAWFTVDAPWPSLRPWIETEVDLARARQAAGQCVAILSDNDPFTSNVARNQRQWEDEMGATVHIVSHAGHFNQHAHPAIWEAFQRHFGALLENQVKDR
jgi:uncharacterized protein